MKIPDEFLIIWLSLLTAAAFITFAFAIGLSLKKVIKNE